MRLYAKYLNIVLLCAAAVVLIGLHQPNPGWFMLAAAAFSLLLCPRQYAKEVSLIHASIALLGLAPITTDISYGHFASMGLALGAAVALPYVVSKYVYKTAAVQFRFHFGRHWSKSEVGYVALAGALAYLVIPFYLQQTGAYLNWPAATDTSSVIRLFVGTNALGIWDELFFICTVLGILRRHFRFYLANLFQAIMFTSFLYELGFTGWAPAIIFPFALSQGYIFKKTESLLYVIAIHLTIDFVLFLALIHAHQPELLDIFIT